MKFVTLAKKLKIQSIRIMAQPGELNRNMNTNLEIQFPSIIRYSWQLQRFVRSITPEMERKVSPEQS